jgi:hypothetical protein
MTDPSMEAGGTIKTTQESLPVRHEPSLSLSIPLIIVAFRYSSRPWGD